DSCLATDTLAQAGSWCRLRERCRSFPAPWRARAVPSRWRVEGLPRAESTGPFRTKLDPGDFGPPASWRGSPLQRGSRTTSAAVPARGVAERDPAAGRSRAEWSGARLADVVH